MVFKQQLGRSIYRLIAIATAICMLSSGMLLGRASSAASSPADIRGAWSEQILLEWMEKGWLNGYPDGTVKPAKEVTRAELFTLVNRSHGFVDEAAVSFSDVKPGTWIAKQVAIAIKAGYAEGYPDGTMQPDRKVTREEVSVMVAKAFGLQPRPEETKVFTDKESISGVGKGAVGALAANGILKGYPDGTFRPGKVITREEAVVILDVALKKLEPGNVNRTYSAAGIYGPAAGTGMIEGNAVITVSGVTLRNTVIQGDLLLSAGIREGEAYLDNVKVKGTVTVNGGGSNSIHLKDSELETLVVDKKNGMVRIVAKGTTAVKRVDLRSGAILEFDTSKGKGFEAVHLTNEMPAGSKAMLLGEFAEVNVAASDVRIELIEGIIKKLNVLSGASGNIVNLEENTNIIELTLEEEANVQGQGFIELAIVGERAKASKFERAPGRLEGRGAPSPSPSPGTGGGGSRDTTAPTAPVVNGVQDQQIYAGPVTPNWSDAPGTTSTATLSKDGSGNVEYTRNTEIAEDGNYILNVTARKSSNGLTAAMTIHFTIDSVPPEPVRIFVTGKSRNTPAGFAYYNVRLYWVDLVGELSTATLQKDDGEPVPYEMNSLIKQDGNYVLTVTTTKQSNGLTAEATLRFTVDVGPAIPIVSGFADKGIYFEPITMAWEPYDRTSIDWTSLRNVETGEVIDDVPNPMTIDNEGGYEFTAGVRRGGEIERYDFQFIIAGIRGIAEGGIYQSAIPDWVEPLEFGDVEAVLSHNGGPAEPYTKGERISEAGEYVLTVTWNMWDINSASQSVRFMIEDPGPQVP